MKTKWCDLFVLGLMQCAEEVGLSRMLEAMNSHLAACSRVGKLRLTYFEATQKHFLQNIRRVRIKEFICETASRLLFLSVHWMKEARTGLKPFTLESVMKTKWCDLFVLGLMQCAEEVGLSRMLEAMNSHLAACSRVGQLKPEKFEEVSQQINFLLLLVNRFAEAKLSPMEFAYLKLVSFTSNDIPTSTCASDTRPLNVTACQELYEHVMASSSSDDSTSEDNETHVTATSVGAAIERYSRLLQLLPNLRWFRESVLVELFFSGLIGNLSIETVIPFVLKMDVMNVFEPSQGSDSILPSASLARILSGN
ncbi:Ligand-binding domain of nuclear hormone receptor [Cooperia oncophora]